MPTWPLKLSRVVIEVDTDTLSIEEGTDTPSPHLNGRPILVREACPGYRLR